MLDVARALALCLAIFRSGRHRFAWGVVLGVAAAYPLAVVMANALAGRPADAPALLGFALVFFGPTAIDGYATGGVRWPLAGFLRAWPLVMPLVSGALAAIAARMATRRASAMRPESDVARGLDAAATPFVLTAVLDGIVVVSAVMLRLLAR